MNPALLLPTGLVALAALLLPLAIHLARRSEHRTIHFAALRWLHAEARPRRNLRFDEWLLLAMRMFLVAALAVLLAKPVLFGTADDAPWIVAVPGIDADALEETEAGSGTEPERRWLAPGFPESLDSPPTAPVALGSLLRELDASMPGAAPLTVLVPEVLDGADAERPMLSRTVDWRIVPTKRPSAAETMVGPRRMATLHVRYTGDRAAAIRYLWAAATAWRASERDTGSNESPDIARTDRYIEVHDVAAPIPQEAKALVWLVPGELPAAIRHWIEAGGTALLDAQTEFPTPGRGTSVRWRERDGTVLVQGTPLGRGQALRWTKAMTPSEMPALLEADFPEHLRGLFAAPDIAPARVPAQAYAPLTGANPWPERPRDLSSWLALLIALLFLVERILAADPRRRSAA